MKKATLALLAGAVISLSGCATSSLIEKDGHTYTKKVKQTLVSDQVLAFGKPALALPNIPQDAVVIVGMKQSYVLTEGGRRFETLLTRLDPRYITLQNSLDFYSAQNDGRFTGKLSFKYTRIKNEITNNDINFFLQNGVKECSSSSDKELGTQGFCFDIPLSGMVYPAVSNQNSLKALSKAYPVTIYTEKEEQSYQAGSNNPLETLVLLPFAVAFDVATLPFQAINKIFD